MLSLASGVTNIEQLNTLEQRSKKYATYYKLLTYSHKE